MKKILTVGMAGVILTAILAVTGCSTTPSYSSLPEESPNAASFVGSWLSHDALVPIAEGSLLSATGQQFYIFYDDGTGEVFSYRNEAVIDRRAFRYRVSDELIGFQFLQGTVFTNGGSFSRPYVFSADKRKITFPRAEYWIGDFAEFTLTTTTPPPDPPPPPPEPEPGDNTGVVYYSYDGTGYVYMDNSVFYHCSDGKPVGYVESGVIYAFNGSGLGFLEGSFIHDLQGKPKGARRPQQLGTDAAQRKPVTKAPKQDLPEKMSKAAVNKPKLRNRYFGGTLEEIF
jgi:hypothetical protein